MPFGFLKRGRRAARAVVPVQVPVPVPVSAPVGAQAAGLHTGRERGVPFTALTEEWRLRGRMQIAGRLSDALNKREAIGITDVTWGDVSADSLDPAPDLKSVDPYDIIIVTAGEDSLPPLTDTERAALRVHKVAYDVALEAPPFRIIGTVFLHPGSEPDRLMDRSTDMFVAVADATARLGEVEVTDPEVEVVLVNRFYLRGISQVDKRTGQPHMRMPGSPMGGTSWQERA